MEHFKKVLKALKFNNTEIENLLDETKIDEQKLSAAEKASGVIANLVAGIIAIFVFFLFIVFAGIALSFFLSSWIGNSWAGFLIVAGLYMILGIIIWAGRGRLIRLPVMNALIKQLFKKEDEEN